MFEGPDPLSAMIGRVSVRGRVYGRPTVCGEWRLALGEGARAAYHVVTAGECWLHAPGLTGPQRLGIDDLVFFPRDAPHVLSDSPAPDVAVPRTERALVGSPTQLLCGTYEGDDEELARLLLGLPDIVQVKASSGGEQMTFLVRLMTQTAREGGAGAAAVLDALSDALFALLIRHCLERQQIHGGTLAALADPRLSGVIRAMHAQPGRSWTLELLAEQAALSRSALCERFSRAMGCSPLHYLTRIRMAEAQALLHSGQFSVAAIAERVGYGTEAAFRRAFRRETGKTPGDARHSGPTVMDAMLVPQKQRRR
jgi:AraC family transcriptional activator of mtrCDE